MPSRALNQMSAPTLRYDAFLALASSLGCVGVEFRNDLSGGLFGGVAPEKVADTANQHGLRILALAEVKCFNDWSDAKRSEALVLCEIAVACGAEAISLIPRNDGMGRGNGERQANLRVSLRELQPLLCAYGLVGLVEPLGFESCSLRHKSEVVEAVDALGATDTFKLVHDTFHHHLAGGGPNFAAHTGIVHISGVTDPGPSVREMRDAHRVLVDADDRLGNVQQLRSLLAAGYDGPISFEPFAQEIHMLSDPEQALARSFEFIDAELAHESA